MSNQLHDWLVVFLIHSDLNLDVKNKNVKGYIPAQVQKDTLFNALSDHKPNENIRIVVIESRIEKSTGPGEDLIRRTFIMEKEGEKFRPYLANVADFDITNEDSVKKVLSNVLEREKARRRMVVTWGHGSILGLFLTEEVRQKIRSDIRASLKATGPKRKRFKTAALECKIPIDVYQKCRKKQSLTTADVRVIMASFDVLTGKELADALRSGLAKEEKIDILVMDNCLMQNVCIQSEMTDVVRFLVGAQSGISYPGFNYRAVLEFLNTGGEISAGEVIDQIIETIKSNKKFTDIETLQFEMECTWSIHAKELVEFKAVETTFTEFIRELKDHQEFKIVVRFLRDTLTHCFNYNKFCLPGNAVVDIKVVLFYFREKIKVFPQYMPIVAAIENCMIAIDAIKGPRLLGNGLFNSDYKFFDTLDAGVISGIGVLFPATDKEIDEKRKEFLLDEELQPAFFTNTGFIDLLKKMKVLN